jgi:hypothetical protein
MLDILETRILTPGYPSSGWLHGRRYTKPDLPTSGPSWKHRTVEPRNIIIRLKSCSLLLSTIQVYSECKQFLQNSYGGLLSFLGRRHVNNRWVQSKQAVQATDLESGRDVGVIGVQLEQGIDPLLSCGLARRQ